VFIPLAGTGKKGKKREKKTRASGPGKTRPYPQVGAGGGGKKQILKLQQELLGQGKTIQKSKKETRVAGDVKQVEEA